MKKYYFTFIFLVLSFLTYSQNQAFISTWEVFPNSLSITIPTSGAGYNYTVDLGDGTVLTNQTGSVSHTYTTAGTYIISIDGAFPRIVFNNQFDQNSFKIKSIDQWGDIQWLSMENAFKFCENLSINASDTPDLSLVENMSGMFAFINAINQDITNWDVSNITNMSHLFEANETFNQNISNWDVSNVTDMSSMFKRVDNFDQDITSWDVSNVTNMSYMFFNVYAFSQDISTWDVSNVTDMNGMFIRAENFHSNISTWDVSNVTNMGSMFFEHGTYNQPLNSWDVSNVTTMYNMFDSAKKFDQDLSSWDVSNVTNMNRMFSSAENFNQDISSWNVSNVTNMGSMFRWAKSFNQDITNWNVSNVEVFGFMFNSAINFNQDLSQWNFNERVCLDTIISNSGLDVDNYDAFLNHIASLNNVEIKCIYPEGSTVYENTYYTYGLKRVDNLKYCDSISRATVVNNYGSMTGDSLYENCGLSVLTSIEEAIIIYPNPAEKIFYIETSNTMVIQEIIILNMYGQHVKSIHKTNTEIDINDLSAGVYFIKITTNLGVISKQLLKE